MLPGLLHPVYPSLYTGELLHLRLMVLMKCPIHPVVPLALVDEIVAVAAQEVAPRSVQDRNPPAAVRSGADEPGPLSSEVARSPGEWHRLLNVFPFTAQASPVAVEESYLAPISYAAD